MFGRNCESEWRSVLGLAALGKASLILRDQSQAGEWYARAAETAQQVIAMTIIEIKPHRNGWKVLEGPGVEPVSGEKLGRPNPRKAAQAFAQARFAFWIRAAMSNASFRSMRRTEHCDAVIRVYNAAGNVIDMHGHAGDFTSSGCVNPHFAVESSDGFANHKTRKTTG
jgi:hypothetical protein